MSRLQADVEKSTTHLAWYGETNAESAFTGSSIQRLFSNLIQNGTTFASKEIK